MFISKRDYNRLSDLRDYLACVNYADSFPFKVIADIVSNIELDRIKHNEYYKNLYNEV